MIGFIGPFVIRLLSHILLKAWHTKSWRASSVGSQHPLAHPTDAADRAFDRTSDQISLRTGLQCEVLAVSGDTHSCDGSNQSWRNRTAHCSGCFSLEGIYPPTTLLHLPHRPTLQPLLHPMLTVLTLCTQSSILNVPMHHLPAL